MRIKSVRVAYDDVRYRAPMKFGNRTVDHITILNVQVAVEGPGGRRAQGEGAMTLANAWSWPALAYDDSLPLMKAHAEDIRRSLEQCPMDSDAFGFYEALTPEWHALGRRVAEGRTTAAMPVLCAAVTASAFDWALHDAEAKLAGRPIIGSARRGGPNLGRLIGREFSGETLEPYVQARPQERLFVYHSVGAGDPLTPGEVTRPVGDGGPECLVDWIQRDGLRYFKVKVGVSDLHDDVARVLAVHDVVAREMKRRGLVEWSYSIDFNETCPDVEYLLEFLLSIRAERPAAFTNIELLEQPTPRDMTAGIDLERVARLKPVVADEAVLDVETLQAARTLGYSGVAVKAGKGLSASLLVAAAAQKWGMTISVMDLTCPGLSFMASATLASHLPGVRAFEANARQYLPQTAHRGWDLRFPTLFALHEGAVQPSCLTGPGLATPYAAESPLSL
jgi:L-alanine-DL-glutamate epimerase-like enolase superfamily enzyme